MKARLKSFILPENRGQAVLRAVLAIALFTGISCLPKVPYAPFVQKSLVAIKGQTNLIEPDKNRGTEKFWSFPKIDPFPVRSDSRLLITVKLENQTPFLIFLTEGGRRSENFLTAGFEADEGFFHGVIRPDFDMNKAVIAIQPLDLSKIPELSSLQAELLDGKYYTCYDLAENFRKFLQLFSAAFFGCAMASIVLGEYQDRRPGSNWCGLAVILAFSVLMALALGQRYSNEHGFTATIKMGSEMQKRAFAEVQKTSIDIKSQWGYDGCQYLQVAFDPLLLKDAGEWHRALDVPSYRAKRILLPWLSFAIGLGQPAWIVQVYSLLNPLFWFFFLFLLCRLNPIRDTRSLAIVLGAALSTGALESMRRSLTDLPSITLAVASIFFLQHSKYRIASVLMAGAGLARETALLSLPVLWKKDRRPWQNLALISIPLVICGVWFGYVKFRFPEATATVSHNFNWPFATMLTRLQQIFEAKDWSRPRELFCVLTMFSFIIQALFLLTHANWKSPWWRMGILFVPVYFCLAMPVWEEYYAVTRAVLPMTIAFNLELRNKTGRQFWAWWLPANLYLWQGFNNWFFTTN